MLLVLPIFDSILFNSQQKGDCCVTNITVVLSVNCEAFCIEQQKHVSIAVTVTKIAPTVESVDFGCCKHRSDFTSCVKKPILIKTKPVLIVSKSDFTANLIELRS